MRRPGGAVLEAGADADDAHAKVMQDRPVAQELVRPQRGERRDRIRERDEAAVGEARRDPDHVLLGDADVDEARRKPLGELLQHGVAEIAGQQQDARMVGGNPGQRRDERLPHDASTSAMAAANSASDIGA
jgi:hypothetical protein